MFWSVGFTYTLGEVGIQFQTALTMKHAVQNCVGQKVCLETSYVENV
jgi:ribosomal protein L6P/L9E